MMRVRGPINSRRLSEAATAALASGDIDALLAANRAEFGGFRMMADEGDDDGDDDDDDAQGGGSDDSDDDKDDSKDDKSEDKSDSDDDAESELEAMRKRMKAADKRAAELDRKLRDLQDKDKPELERAKTDLEEITAERDLLRKEMSDLRLQNAFLTANKVTWHDPDTALALAQSKGYLEDVVDEDDGSVDRKALAKALERLSKEHKYLVKGKEKKEDDEPDGPSGESAGGRSDNSKDARAKKQAMRNRFPVLNR
jgi:hypothetical protein